MSGCGSEACGCAGGERGEGGRAVRSCPRCGSQSHPVKAELPGNILKAAYTGANPNLCLNPTCEVCYFDPETNEVFYNKDCETGIWFKEDAPNHYICYCEKISEREIIETVVETGLDDLGSVMLYLRENISEDCELKQPAGVSCNRYVQETIEKARIVREALTDYKGLKPDSKEIPHQLIEERYNKYLQARELVGGACCGGGCGCA
ncbi:MAG: hypothetical protein AAF975_04095 [Spirochaetota bacterium]